MTGGIEQIAELPGARSAELLKLRDEYVTRSLGIVCPAFIDRAEGSHLYDVDGNRFIDMAGGVGVNLLGNLPPAVISALRAQLERYMHLCFGIVYFEEYVRLAERLAHITPGDFAKRSFLNNSGSEAIENAIKVARHFTRRPKILSFVNAFHGRTMYALAMTGKEVPYKVGFEPFPAEVLHAPYPYCYRCPFGREEDDCSLECLETLSGMLTSDENRDGIASVIIEPMQGEGGFVLPPAEFVRGVRELCADHSIILIDDEIQTGFGRTGRMFCIEHFGIVPDIIVSGKALGGGLPLSALTGRADIMDSPPKGGLGGTFGGNPMSCAAALATIDVVEGNMGRVTELHSLMYGRLSDMQSRHEIIGDVRGLGLMMAIELVRNGTSREPAKDETAKIVSACARRGMVVLSAGLHGNVIRMHPSIMMDAGLLSEAMDILEDAIKAQS